MRYINSKTNQPYSPHEILTIEGALPSGVSFDDWYKHGEQLPPCPLVAVGDYLARDMPDLYRSPVRVWQAKQQRAVELDSTEQDSLFFGGDK